ncbi:CD48 antigen-like [Thunnus thynnus]|uniref:SLAM family member 9-like n=1 Tax=Thunnus maccoyii TaxID=8240 RepID=UPI001C4B838B|nr:SLAM family member 9-like [Thunnus maccoyii]|eukprot:superscaffoldBa00004336_g18699
MEPQLRRKHFAVYFTSVLLSCVWAGENEVAAREGATVTLKTRESGSYSNIQIVWTFGTENPNMRIAIVKSREVRSEYDERFRGRLQLDSWSGALTITNLRLSDSGVYMWQSIGSTILFQNFHLTVYSSVSPPTIKVNASLVNTRCSSLTVECSVENSRELILSWFRGRERLKTTSSPNLSTRVFLPLEIQYHDGDNYSCLAENPVEEKATKLHTEDTCLKNEESWCQTEATVRLVISAVVGMALIFLIVDHMRLRR